MGTAGSPPYCGVWDGKWARIEYSKSGGAKGLKVPQKQRPRGRLWLNDGSCVRLRPERPNQVWSYDFMSARTQEGRTLRLLSSAGGNAWRSGWRQKLLQ